MIHSREDLLWESLTTFYYRGRFGAPSPPPQAVKAPEVTDGPISQWETARGGGPRCARLSGDYNGIHYWRWYARRLGFARAFFHPHRILGQCMANLPSHPGRGKQRLDAWFKGPVYYGSHVALRAARDQEGVVFALQTDADVRPAIVGRWYSQIASQGGILDPQK